MDLTIIEIIIKIIGIIVGIIVAYIEIRTHPEVFKKLKQKLKNLFKAPLLPLGKFVKYAIFLLIVGSFMYISIMQGQQSTFDAPIYNTIGLWGLCFLISIAIILTIEQDTEKGDKELPNIVHTLAHRRSRG